MAAINVESAGRPRARGPYRSQVKHWNGTAHRLRSDLDPAMIFAAAVLLTASLIRLVPPLLGREGFGVEPTLALGATLACAWITAREALYRLLDYRAARRARRRPPARSPEA